MLALFVLLFGFTAFRGHVLQEEPKNRVIVNLTNLRSTDGKILISIYNSPETFPGEDTMLEQKILADIRDKKMKIRFNHLPAGTYAIAALHDENGDEKMNFNLIGMPREGYCFSNNVRPKLRRPTWDEAKFEVNKATTHIRIEMKY